MGPPVEPVTPIPNIHSLKNVSRLRNERFTVGFILIMNFSFLKQKNYEEDKVLVELKGENFNSNLKIWIDDVECQTIYK